MARKLSMLARQSSQSLVRPGKPLTTHLMISMEDQLVRHSVLLTMLTMPSTYRTSTSSMMLLALARKLTRTMMLLALARKLTRSARKSSQPVERPGKPLTPNHVMGIQSWLVQLLTGSMMLLTNSASRTSTSSTLSVMDSKKLPTTDTKPT
jgi:hypothetical protein